MDIKSFDDIVKLQQEFSAKLAEHARDLPERRPGTVDEMLAEMRATLKQSKADLEAVHRAKNEAVKRFDGEVQRHEQAIAQLELRLEDLEKAKHARKNTDPDKPTPARKRPAKS